MNESDKLRIYVNPNRISRLPRGYRNLDQPRGDRWVWLTLLLMFLTGVAVLYGLYKLVHG